MLQRLRKLWALSKKDTKSLDSISLEDISKLPDAGDGQAVFLSEGTEEDFKKFDKKQKGLYGLFGTAQDDDKE